jgi:hypothetical protein
VLITVAKKNTLHRLSGQFGAFAGSKENIAHAPKHAKSGVVRRTTRETLHRNTTLQSSRRLDIDEIGGCGDSLSPKVGWKRGGDHHRTSRLKKVAMLALSNAILSVSTRTRELGESTLFGKKTTQHLGDILTSRVSTKNTDGRGKLGVNHGSKSLVYGENLTARFHQIKPSIAREVINKKNIVAMTTFRIEGSRTPYIRMN